MNGVVVVNKPKGITSHDVVRRMRHIAAQRDVGHLGTLDPMATGVLPLVLGRMTRIAQFYDHSEKTYEGTILFGFATNTYDAEGKIAGEAASASFSREELEVAMAEFRGEIQQTPPPFSAKKVDGVPAYKLARKNESLPLKAVNVTVRKFEVSDFRVVTPSAETHTAETGRAEGLRFAEMSFVAEVSSGTYVRSLAHGLGQRLGVGGHLKSLCRTRSADFVISQSHSLEELESAASRGELELCAIPARKLLPHMPNVNATEDQMTKIRHGNAVNLAEFSQAEFVKIFDGYGELAAIAKRVAGTLFQPKVVMV